MRADGATQKNSGELEAGSRWKTPDETRSAARQVTLGHAG
jgi:hypothetical protein